ncbi:MAG TPA: hypothetical protein VN631_17920 [Negativicutes bacterium]|nr:hypothetical protein [Negativicutes bacterium]
MADNNLRKLSRAGLLLALTIVFQSLRFFVPLPAVASTFLVGSLVNACLLIALQTTGLGPAFLIAGVTPIVAYFQQLLPLPIFILPVAVGNSLYVWLFYRLLRIGPVWPAIGGAAFGKAAFFYLAFSWILTFIQLPPVVTAGLLFVMGWPQLITGILGGVLACLVGKKLQPIMNESMRDSKR